MKILFRTSSSDENYDANITAAFVDLDKDLAQLIMKRRKAFMALKAEDDELLEIYFWNRNCIWLENDKVEDCMPEGDFHTQEHADFDFDADDDARTECDQMVVGDSGVYWTCIPKHSDVYISTPVIEFAKIEALL